VSAIVADRRVPIGEPLRLRLEVGQDLLGQRVTAVEPSGSSSRARAVSHRMKAPASSV
jgi:hypothetical protein